MEAWLLFPFRLVVIAIIATLVYCACDAVERRLTMGPTEIERDVDRTADRLQPKPVHPLPILAGVLTFLTILIVVESLALKKFRHVVNQIEELEGSVRFDPPRTTPLGQYHATTATVDLSDTSVDDTSLPALKFLPNLKALRLANTEIGSDVVSKLKSCSRLERLDLSQTEISDTDLKPLQSLRRIRALIINDTQITDAAVPYLSLCQSLTKLELEGTSITDAGRRELKASLPNTTIEGASVAT